jgi:hypothetical protein
VWPFLKKGFIPSWVFGRPWTEPVEFRPTAGPGPRHTAVAIGVTGQLASLRGRALETYRVTTLDRERNAVSVVSALHLDLPQEPLAVSAQ